jgi:hypothetical protein
MNKKIYILHSVNGRLYFHAVEYFAKLNNYQVIYREKSCINHLITFLINVIFSLKKFVRIFYSNIYSSSDFN